LPNARTRRTCQLTPGRFRVALRLAEPQILQSAGVNGVKRGNSPLSFCREIVDHRPADVLSNEVGRFFFFDHAGAIEGFFLVSQWFICTLAVLVADP